MRSPLNTCKKTLDSIKRFGAEFVHRKEGQMAPVIMTSLLIAYAIFMGAAIDMANVLWHKNHATTAANAACLAGAADLVWVANQGTAQAVTAYQSSPTGFPMSASGNSVSGDCASASPSVAMCAYAKANGYDPAASGNDISWTVSNILPPQHTINPNGLGSESSYTMALNAAPETISNGVLPFLQVNVQEKVPTYLLSLLPWFHSPLTVVGQCNCGISSKPATGSMNYSVAINDGNWFGASAVFPVTSADVTSGAYTASSSGVIATGYTGPVTFTYQTTCSGVGGFTINYSLNNGSTWANASNYGCTVGMSSATAPGAVTLPAGYNMNNLEFQIIASCGGQYGCNIQTILSKMSFTTTGAQSVLTAGAFGNY